MKAIALALVLAFTFGCTEQQATQPTECTVWDEAVTCQEAQATGHVYPCKGN